VTVHNEAEEAKTITELNEKYKELCKNRAGNDLYTERGMMTFNDAPKLKVIQTGECMMASLEVLVVCLFLIETSAFLVIREVRTGVCIVFL